MENASKALLMAGEIIIAILILSLFVYLFANFSNNTELVEEKFSAEEIDKINTKFVAYENEKIRTQDVITIIHLAQEFNYKFEDNNKIEVWVSDIKYTEMSEDELIFFLKSNLDNDKNWKISSVKYGSNGIIKEVHINEVS